MRRWSIYLIECSDKSIYTGISNNVEKRINKHNSGNGAKYTKNKRPVKLLLQKEIGSKSEASKEEYRIKQLSKSEKLNYIKNNSKDNTMSALTQLEEVKKQINDLVAKTEKHYEKQFELSQLKNDLAIAALKETELLKGTEWNIQYYDRDNTFRLDSIDDKENEKKLDEVSKLLNCEYHDSRDLNKNIRLRVDDFQRSIYFKNIPVLINFVKEYEIIVHFDKIEKEIEFESKKIKILKNFVKNFKKHSK